MAVALVCRADLIAATRATVDGYADESPDPCRQEVTYQVTCRLVPGFEVAADVCTGHQQMVERALPGSTRTVPKHVRT